jgi:hypothetical protein
MAEKPLPMPKPGEAIIFDHIAGKVYVGSLVGRLRRRALNASQG